MQGDVIAIYDTAGAVQAKYSYDAFGNCTVTDSTNSHLANYNPIRYRGYYWDSETNWYFLNARYYSPEWRRFISPDDTAYLNPKNVNGLNLYCYCNNDPINFVDPSGCHPFVFFLITTVVVGIFAIWGAFQGASLSHKVEGNIDMSLPGTQNESNVDEVLTTDDIAMNTAMGALAFAHVGAVLVSGMGAVYAFVEPISGAQLFAFGALYAIALSLLLIPFGMQVENPELDPSDIYQPDLPQYK